RRNDEESRPCAIKHSILPGSHLSLIVRHHRSLSTPPSSAAGRLMRRGRAQNSRAFGLRLANEGIEGHPPPAFRSGQVLPNGAGMGQSRYIDTLATRRKISAFTPIASRILAPQRNVASCQKRL